MHFRPLAQLDCVWTFDRTQSRTIDKILPAGRAILVTWGKLGLCYINEIRASTIYLVLRLFVVFDVFLFLALGRGWRVDVLILLVRVRVRPTAKYAEHVRYAKIQNIFVMVTT